MTNTPQKNAPQAPKPTVSHMLGEITWLLSQSPIFKQLRLVDLEWLIMPPLMLEQYRVFRDDKGVPAGLALWAYLNKEGEEKLLNKGRIDALDWNVNSMQLAHLKDAAFVAAQNSENVNQSEAQSAEASTTVRPNEGEAPAEPLTQSTGGSAKESSLWLVELITPFATEDNKMPERMLSDLMKGPFAGKSFKFLRTDAITGEKTTMTINAPEKAA